MMLVSALPHFRAAGYETHVLSTGVDRGGFAPALERAGCVVHHIPFDRRLAFAHRFHRLVAAVKPHVTHVHCERAAPLYAGLAAPSARVIRTIHACFDFTGTLRLRKGGERWLCRRVFGVIHAAPSPSVRDNERHRFMNDTALCPNWYDDSRFFPPTDAERHAARRDLGFAPDDFVVASVGNHEPVKNYHRALQAIRQLPPERRVRFLHVGRPIDPSTGESLPQLAAGLDLSDQARFVGQSDEVPRYLHAADIHMMPSMREGFGMAAVEAMASGLPQILADVPGLADFKGIAPGVVHASPTVNGLAAALAAMSAISDAERRQAGLAIAVAARSRFSTATGVARYVQLYGSSNSC
ncbi:glycosyltransferase [Azospirillum sp. TSH100]|uniref:glycosyltransferase n=2 Tax=Azospirillum sp. TSH100 TaxID=652764 RepID=UPI002494ACCC|nr:glycosyltransferase [Azospirillum sp. TSH100]